MDINLDTNAVPSLPVTVDHSGLRWSSGQLADLRVDKLEID